LQEDIYRLEEDLWSTCDLTRPLLLERTICAEPSHHMQAVIDARLNPWAYCAA